MSALVARSEIDAVRLQDHGRRTSRLLPPCAHHPHQHADGFAAGTSSASSGRQGGMPFSQWLWQLKAFTDRPDVRLVVQGGQLVASLLFIVLYVWSTYSPALPGSARHQLDLLLCLVFACDYVFRVAVSDIRIKDPLRVAVLLQAASVSTPCWVLCRHACHQRMRRT
jgi:hypothetical protein